MFAALADFDRAVLGSRRVMQRFSWHWSRDYKIVHRNDFPRLLNFLGLTGEGAEIGTCTGKFAERLLRTWNGRHLHCVDPWRDFTSDPTYIAIDNVQQQEHDRRFAESQRRTARFAGRCTLHRQTSADAASSFAAGQLDFVYIDAQHHFEAVVEDLQLWAGKVRPGGYLAGHDYLDASRPEGLFGVKSAVDQWARDHQLPLIVSQESDFPSWFIRIPN